MAVTLTFINSSGFASDSENILTMESTEQNEAVFFFRVQTYKDAVLVGTDNIYNSPTGINTFDLSTYSRYLTELDEVVTYSIVVSEVVNGVTLGNSSISKKVCKAWVNQYEADRIDLLEETFLTDFRNNTFDNSLVTRLYYSIFNNRDYKTRVVTYDVNGATISDVTSPVFPTDFLNVDNYIGIGSTTHKIALLLLDGVTNAVLDQINYNKITDCSNVVVEWRSQYGVIEQMALTHNTVNKTNIDVFSFESESGQTDYLKTWRNGGTIYTHDLNDAEQKKVLNMLQSPFIELSYKDEYNQTRKRRIKVNTTNWVANQQFYEDTKSFSIDFTFSELEKSILL